MEVSVHGRTPLSLDGLFHGKLTVCYGKSQLFMGKSTISMAIFNSYVSHYQRVFHGKSS